MNEPTESIRWLPPEWAAQHCVLLTWPHDQGDWGDELGAVEQTFITMARAIARYQPLVIFCHDDAYRDRVRSLLGNPESIALVIAPSNDIWVRDYSPVTVINNGTRELLDFRFNGWGGRYPAGLDDRITRTLLAARVLPGVSHTPLDTVLEGGAIETDGQGTLLVTSQCLLNPNRNGPVDRQWFQTLAARYLGCDRILWLDHGYLQGDDTDGHVDMLARFGPDNRIIYTACDDPADSHYRELAAMAEQLSAFRTRNGAPYALHPLPWPPETRDADGNRLPLSYANFLVINGAVLVPTYDVHTDEEALRVIAACFPEREIIPIPARPLIRQHGSVHCATMQVPYVVS